MGFIIVGVGNDTANMGSQDRVITDSRTGLWLECCGGYDSGSGCCPFSEDVWDGGEDETDNEAEEE